MDGVEAVGVQRIVEVYKVKLGLNVVTVVVVQQLVENLGGKARKFVVIDKQGVLLLDHLAHEGRIDGGRLAGARRSQNHASTLG